MIWTLFFIPIILYVLGLWANQKYGSDSGAGWFVGAFMTAFIVTMIFLATTTHTESVAFQRGQYSYTQYGPRTVVLLSNGESFMTDNAGSYNLIHDSTAYVIRTTGFSEPGIQQETKYSIEIHEQSNTR